MTKKTKPQIYLERVGMIETIIEGKLAEQRQWKDLALSLTANMGGERVQASGSKSKMADAVDRCLDLEVEIADAVYRLIAEKQEVVKTLEKLNNPTHYRILHMRYIRHMELKEIAEALKVEYTTVTTTHGRALKNLQCVMERGDA